MSETFVRKAPAGALSVVGVILIALLVYLVSNPAGGEVQPLVYNHKVHIENVGLECVDCHMNVETMASATIPTLEVCQNCHSDEPISESPEEVKLLSYVAEETEIPWIRIYGVPDHVYFSHRRHVVGGELECSVCHGSVAELTEPVLFPFQPITMENCMRCHRQSNVTNDCLTCHR